MNPLYLGFDHVNGYTEEKWVNKYLVFDSTYENNRANKNRMMFLMELGTKSKKNAVMSVIMKKTI